ncbi:MAG: carbohydrate-binding protein [Pseudobdellovibrio sp.]
MKNEMTAAKRRKLKSIMLIPVGGLLIIAFQDCHGSSPGAINMSVPSSQSIIPSTDPASGAGAGTGAPPAATGGPVAEAPPVSLPIVTNTTNKAYLGVPAKDFTNQNGMVVDPGGYLSYIDNADWVQYSKIDFESGARWIYCELALDKAGGGGTIEIVLDSINGQLIADGSIDVTAGWNKFNYQVFEISQVTGVHDLFIRFKGAGGIANLKSWAIAK